MLRRVENFPGLVRNTDTKAILNTDVASLQAYKARREKERKLSQIVEQWDRISNEISDLREMLTTILQKLEKIDNK